ncbi:MAG: DUF1045 domain-containing protein [Amaricoccus sp.]|uniref:DUF1045 domain-containing protein n=1 Tax=Amaricoccus sp. TaxID=1872485 RepID=UPI0033162D56
MRIMRDIRRWAIYYVPAEKSAFARFGADWLGWDAQAGRAIEGYDPPGLPLPRAEITAQPRKYGFHATLKAPFVLGDDREPAALDAAITALAGEFEPFALPLVLGTLGSFLALLPGEPNAPLDALAAACVTRLDTFRAPEAAEHRRRHPGTMTERQRAYFGAWGYPFVLEEFHFHMTLTGALGPEDRAKVAAALGPLVAPLLAEPRMVRDICLVGEDRQGMFHLLKRFPLARGPAI